MSSLERVLLQITRLLTQLGIEYAIMGGLAVRIHGIPRPTNDVDFTVAISRERLAEFYQSVTSLGYTVPEIYQQGWLDRVAGMAVIKIRTWLEEGKGIDVDFFLAETEFQQSVLQRRQSCEQNGQEVWIVSPEDLILLKLIAGRTRDLADVADILFVQGPLDSDYMTTWAERLQIAEKLIHALKEFD